MKQFLLPGLALATAFSLGAAVNHPESFSGEFQDYSIPSDWSMIGRDATPSGTYAHYFKNYSATNSYTVLTASGIAPTAFSPSEFSDGQKSDEWLITPEFTVGSDAELLCFTATTTGNTAKNNFAVYLSEDGASKEDFRKTQLVKTAVQGSQSISSSQRRVVLQGYAGKKIRLAFVNMDNSQGVFGFGSISVAPYYLGIEDAETLETIVMDAADPSMSFKIKVSTPVIVEGLKAVLTLDNGEEYTYEYSGKITPNMFTTVTPTFTDIDFKGASQIGYTVTISLNDESLEPSTLTGVMVNAERRYPAVVVAEEFTGTWCGYCPIGTAYMAYYRDHYDGSQAGGGKFYVAAVHGNDPMQSPATYFTPASSLAEKLGMIGYPTAMLNRRETVYPAQLNMDSIMAQKSFGRVSVTRVDHDAATGAMKVYYSPRISFSTPGFGINASAVVIENDLRGSNSQWSQTNNYNRFTSKDIADQLGEEMVPYMAQFVDRPNQPMVPYTQMVYNEVVRDVFPSFNGQPLEGAWTADTDREEVLEFTMPQNVTDPEHSAVLLVLTNASSGEIISADYVTAEYYNRDLSGVESAVSGEGLAMHVFGGKVIVECESEGYAEILSIDGKIAGRTPLKAGRNEIELPAGLSIVTAVTSEGRAILKTIN